MPLKKPTVSKPAAKKATAGKPATKKATASSVPAKKATASAVPAKTAPASTPKKEAKVDEPKEVGISIKLGELSKELMGDAAQYKESGRWPLVVDPSGTSATFLQYRNVNFLKAMSPLEVNPSSIRQAVIGGLRYGKPVVLDLGDADLFDSCIAKFDEVQKGLMEDILSKEITRNEKYLTLVRDSDGPDYAPVRFYAEINNFVFVILTKINPASSLKKRTFVIEIAA